MRPSRCTFTYMLHSGHRIFKQTVHFPHANAMVVTFDRRCSTINGNDSVRFYKDSAMKVGHFTTAKDFVFSCCRDRSN